MKFIILTLSHVKEHKAYVQYILLNKLGKYNTFYNGDFQKMKYWPWEYRQIFGEYIYIEYLNPQEC